jgi:hypothetical protein
MEMKLDELFETAHDCVDSLKNGTYSALRDVKGNILGSNDASHGESEESGLHGE